MLHRSNTGTVINEQGADKDFRVEGDTDANLFFADAGNSNIGIGTATPSSDYKLDIVGSVLAENGAVRSSLNAINDDAVATFNPDKTAGAMLITSRSDTTAWALIGYGTSPSINILTRGTNVTVGTSALDGNDGTDGKLNVGWDGTTMYLENRRGGTRTFQVLMI